MRMIQIALLGTGLLCLFGAMALSFVKPAPERQALLSIKKIESRPLPKTTGEFRVAQYLMAVGFDVDGEPTWHHAYFYTRSLEALKAATHPISVDALKDWLPIDPSYFFGVDNGVAVYTPDARLFKNAVLVERVGENFGYFRVDTKDGPLFFLRVVPKSEL